MSESSRSAETHYVRCLKCNKILKCSRYDTTVLLEHIRLDHPEIDIIESLTQSRACGGQSSTKSRSNQSSKNKIVQTKDGQSIRFNKENTFEKKAGAEKPYPKVETKDKIPTTKDEIECECNEPEPEPVVEPKPEPVEEPCDDAIECECDAEVEPVPVQKPYSTQTLPACQTCKKSSKDIRVCESDPCAARVVYTRKYKTRASPRSDYKRKLYRTSIQKWSPAEGTIYCPKCGCRKRPLIRTHAERSSSNSCGAAFILACWPLCFLPFLCPQSTKEYLHCANCKNFLGLYDRNNNCVKPNKEYVELFEEEKKAETKEC